MSARIIVTLNYTDTLTTDIRATANFKSNVKRPNTPSP